MQTFTLHLTRRNGLIGAAVVLVALACVLFRVATLGETDDPGLREAVRRELLTRLGGRTARMLASVDRADCIPGLRSLTHPVSQLSASSASCDPHACRARSCSMRARAFWSEWSRPYDPRWRSGL